MNTQQFQIGRLSDSDYGSLPSDMRWTQVSKKLWSLIEKGVSEGAGKRSKDTQLEEDQQALALIGLKRQPATQDDGS